MPFKSPRLLSRLGLLKSPEVLPSMTDMDMSGKRKAFVILASAFAAVIGIYTLAVIALFPTIRPGVVVGILASLIFAMLAVLARQADTVKPHAFIFIMTAIICASLGAFINGGVDGYVAPFLIIAPIAAGYFLGLRTTIACGIVSIAMAAGLIMLDLQGLVVEAPYSERLLTIASGFVVISTIVMSMVCVVSFATHVREDAARLSQSSAKLTAFARNAPIAIAMFDRELRYVEVSDRWLNDYSLVRDEIIGRSHYDIFPEIPQSWIDVHQRCLAGKTERSDADRFERADGTVHWMMWEVKPWHDQDGEVAGLVMITRNISAQMEQQAELEAARAKASRVSEMKSAFLANLSHEIRTPLNGMMGLAQSLQDDDLPAEQHGKAVTIHETGKMMLTLLNDVLDLSKLDAEKMELNPTAGNLKEVLGRTIDLFKPGAGEKGLSLQAYYSGMLPDALLFDQTRLVQCINNLVSNAVKFTASGCIDIKAHFEPDPAAPSTGTIVIDVSDTGIGIATEQQDALFNDFTQAEASTAASYGGTGLGLALSRRLARLMDGDLVLLKSGTGGSTFRLTIASHQADAIEPATQDSAQYGPQRPAPLSVLRQAHIIIADDVKTNRMVAELMLEPHGARITHAANGQEVLDLLETDDVDLVLLDLQMPVLDGAQTITRIRANTRRWASLPVIALTGETDVHDRQDYLRMGLSDVILKPLEKDAFLKTVSSHLAHARQIQKMTRRTA